jgi:hypothetical protein
MMTKAWILFLQLFFKTKPIALKDSKPQKLRLQIWELKPIWNKIAQSNFYFVLFVDFFMFLYVFVF